MLRFVYVAYFVAIGVVLPFFPPYLRSLGLSGAQVSLVMSMGAVGYVLASLLWGWVADRTRRPVLVLRLACSCAALCLAPLIFVRTMPAILYLYGAHQLFAVAILGLVDSLAVERARQLGEDYARLRLWGSVSFIISCWSAGQALLWRGHREGDPLVPLLMTAGFVLAVLASFTVSGAAAREPRPQAREVRVLLGDDRFVFLLAVAALHWAGNATYNGFFSILVHDRGLPPSVSSYAFVVGVAGEMAAFYAFRGLARRWSLLSLLAISFAGSALRWLVVAASASAGILIAVQALHTLTFGVFWAAGVAWLGACVPPALRTTGQTLYNAATFGLGNLIGMLGAGLVYDATGGAGPAFATAAGADVVALLLVVALAARGRAHGRAGARQAVAS
jgi:MFS transporter, PPP family, 3-phenylpropionic acid transporter